MDCASKSLNHITQSGEYVRIPGVVVFDEHDEFTPGGKLLRRFDRKTLQTIAERCNRREQVSGDLAPGGPGHTRDDVTNEEDQPPVWLYARNYRVGEYGPNNKVGLICDFHVKRKIETKDGRVVDGPEYVKSFPRRSPELWPDSPAVPEHARLTIDWHALLRRSPQRDLGLLTYARTPVQKIRYSMEAAMPDPVMPPDAKANTDIETDGDDMPEGHEEFARHLDHAFANHPVLKYMMSTFESQAEGDGSVDRYHRKPAEAATTPASESETITRYQRQIDELRAESAAHKHESRKLRYERQLFGFREQGIDVDVAVELEDCLSMGSEEEVEKHFDRIQRRYARTPVGGDLPVDAIAQDHGKDPLNDPKVYAKCMDHARKNGITGEGAYYKAAKELNYIK